MQRNKTSPERVSEALVKKALFRGYAIGSPDSISAKIAIEFGKELPERCKPGYLIECLPVEQREAIERLTSKMVNHRIK